MKGNGQFVIRPENNKIPMRLQLNQMSNNAVEVMATLGDGTAQTLCVFREGTLVVCDLSLEIAMKMGIELDSLGHIRVCAT